MSAKYLKSDRRARGLLSSVAADLNQLCDLLNNTTIDGNPARISAAGIELNSAAYLSSTLWSWSGILWVYGRKYYSPDVAGTQTDGTSIGNPGTNDRWIKVTLSSTSVSISYTSEMTTPWGDNIRYRDITRTNGDLYVEC
jgi:hypothetical protein